MSAFKQHLVAVVPAAYRDSANALSEGQGWGPGVYSVELSETAKEPATHYGLSTYVTSAFFATLEEQSAANPQVAAVLDQIHMSVIQAGSETPLAHFNRTIAALGFRTIETLMTPS